MDYSVSVNQNKIVIESTKKNYEVSLSRTGGQGAKGDSITDAYFTEAGNLILVISNSAGQVVEEVDTGNFVTAIDLDLGELADVTLTDIGDNHIISYDAETQEFVNHKLTTSRLSNVDETALTDGAMLLYNGTTSKYIATTQLDNENTTIIGGSF